VKDLSRLNRDLARTIIIDNSPESYVLQPENAIPIKSFFGDNNDTSLLDLIPFLKDIVNKDVSDVRSVLKKCHLKVVHASLLSHKSCCTPLVCVCVCVCACA
jgi:TFIIF-interacting CTD phosphatase-like protein